MNEVIRAGILAHERCAILVSGALWAYYCAYWKLPALAYWAPAILCALLGLRVLGLHRQLEGKSGKDVTAVLFWTLLLLINVLVAAFYVPLVQGTGLLK